MFKSMEKKQKISLILFLVIVYLILARPITQFMYLIEAEDYFEKVRVPFGIGMHELFNIGDAGKFMQFFYSIVLDPLYYITPVVGAMALLFGKKTLAVTSNVILSVMALFAFMAKGPYEDTYSKVGYAIELWFILACIVVIYVLLFVNSNSNRQYNYVNQQYNMPQYNYNQGQYNPQQYNYAPQNQQTMQGQPADMSYQQNIQNPQMYNNGYNNQ